MIFNLVGGLFGQQSAGLMKLIQSKYFDFKSLFC